MNDQVILQRPQTRADCKGGFRPCPWATCRWHLAHVRKDCKGGKVAEDQVPDVAEWPETCVLDVADRRGATLDVVGQAMALTRERVRQIEQRGIRMMARRGVRLMDFLDMAPPKKVGDPAEIAVRLRKEGKRLRAICNALAEQGHLGWTDARLRSLLEPLGLMKPLPKGPSKAEQMRADVVNLLREKAVWLSAAEIKDALPQHNRNYLSQQLTHIGRTHPDVQSDRFRMSKKYRIKKGALA